MIKTILFDLDGTLYDYDSADAAGLQQLRQYVREQFGMQKSDFDRAYRSTMEEVTQLLGIPCAAMHDRYLRFHILLENAGLPLSPHVWEMTRLYWDTLIHAMKPSPGIISCIPALKKSGYCLGVGTNMQIDYQIRKLERLELIRYFDFIVSSEEVMAEKPDARLFLRCVQKAGCRADECLFIGDNLHQDVLGAQKAGLNAIWFQPDGNQAAMHPEIESICHFGALEDKFCIFPAQQ